MTVANVAGLVRQRKHQVGFQSALLTAVPATRVMPYRGNIDVNPNRTDPDVDTGSLDPIIAPTLGPQDISATWAGAKVLAFNDLPVIWSAALKGGVTPTGAVAKTWHYQIASLTADSFDVLTDEYGDDTSATDGIQAIGGVIDSFDYGFADDLGVWDINAALIFAKANMATDRTAALTVDSNPTWLYGGQTLVYNDTTPGSIGITPWLSTIHGANVSVANNLDKKRFANGSNNHKQLSGYGRGQRVIEIKFTTAKTAQAITERATLTAEPSNRYLALSTTSDVIITGSTTYSALQKFPARLFSVTDGEIGGNATLEFTYHAFYSATLGYAGDFTTVNTLAALP